MKKLYWEILLGLIFVVSGTFVAYNLLLDIRGFWTAQKNRRRLGIFETAY